MQIQCGVTFDNPRTHFELSLADHLFGRVYYLTCILTDSIQLICKVAFACFATGIASLFLGQSDILNQWVKFAWSDATFSAKMLMESIRGVFDPLSAYAAKFELHKANVKDYFNEKVLSKINVLEQLPCRLLLLARMVEEVVNILLSSLRLTLSTVLFSLSLGQAEGMGVIALGASGSLVRSIIATTLCFMGVISVELILEQD